jgi:hypothetical protein
VGRCPPAAVETKVLRFTAEGSSRWKFGGYDPVKKAWRMGRCGLESGDAFAAIPVRNLILFRSPAPPPELGGETWKNHGDIERIVGLQPRIQMRERSILALEHMLQRFRRIGTPASQCALLELAPVICSISRTGSNVCGVRTIAMESTGVYWIPAYEILEQRGFEVVLVNARDAKHVPGRKTDVSDAQWLQRLHEYGLLRASFRPKGELAALRAYVRQRVRLLDYSASHIQHLQKALMQMNVQLHHVVTDMTGTTGMRIIRAIVEGERDPMRLASYRDPRCHASVDEIGAALSGNWREEHIFALGQALELYDTCRSKIAECDVRVEAMLGRLRDAASIAAQPLPPVRHRDAPQMRRRSMLARRCTPFSA